MIAVLFLLAQHPKGNIMSFEQYAKVKHSLPYILDITQGKGRIIYYGVKHTRDPKDKQIKQLRALWQKLKPAQILNEDITPEPRPTLEEAIKFDGERGALAFWANKENIPIRSIDMNWRKEVMSLPVTIPAANIKLFYLIRGLQQDIQRPNGKPVTKATDEIVQKELDNLQDQGLGWFPKTIEDINNAWLATKIQGDWRAAKIEWITPTGNGKLNKISRTINQIRDQHMIHVLNEELKKGKTTLAVVGASHVVMQQPALPGKVKKM